MMGYGAFDIGLSLSAFAPATRTAQHVSAPRREAKIEATRGGWHVSVTERDQRSDMNVWREIFSRTVPRLVDAVRLAENFAPQSVRVVTE